MLCDYIYNTMHINYALTPALYDFAIYNSFNPTCSETLQIIYDFFAKTKLSLPSGAFLFNLQACHPITTDFLTYTFKYFYPTLTRLFMLSLFELINRDTKDMLPLRRCYTTILTSCAEALSRQKSRINPPTPRLNLYAQPHNTAFHEETSPNEQMRIAVTELGKSMFANSLFKDFETTCPAFISHYSINNIALDQNDKQQFDSTYSEDCIRINKWKDHIRSLAKTFANDNSIPNINFISDNKTLSLAQLISYSTSLTPTKHIADLPDDISI